MVLICKERKEGRKDGDSISKRGYSSRLFVFLVNFEENSSRSSVEL